MSEWRYIASRLNGDGTETFLDFNLPLNDVSVQSSLSGHGGLDAKISPEVVALKPLRVNLFSFPGQPRSMRKRLGRFVVVGL